MGQPSRLSAPSAVSELDVVESNSTSARAIPRVSAFSSSGGSALSSVHSIFLERILMVLVLLLIVLVTQPLLLYVAPGVSEPLWIPVLFYRRRGGLGLLL